MQEEKSAVYTVILGICLLLCLLMLGNMLMGRADTGTAPAAPEEDTAMEFHITEDDIWCPLSCARRCCSCRNAASCTAHGARLSQTAN